MIYRDARPNKAHIKLAELEQEGKSKQKLRKTDGHQLAGSKTCLSCTVPFRNYCMKCRKRYSLDYISIHKAFQDANARA